MRITLKIVINKNYDLNENQLIKHKHLISKICDNKQASKALNKYCLSEEDKINGNFSI